MTLSPLLTSRRIHNEKLEDLQFPQLGSQNTTKLHLVAKPQSITCLLQQRTKQHADMFGLLAFCIAPTYSHENGNAKLATESKDGIFI